MLRLGDLIERPAIIREAREHYSTFKITPIGGPKELQEWKKQQAVKLAMHEAQREVHKEKKKEFLAGGPDAPIGELTWEGKVLLSDPKKWDDKLRAAQRKRLELKQRQILTDEKAWVFSPAEPKLTRWEKVKSWFKKLIA